jgi:hypothetical protein
VEKLADIYTTLYDDCSLVKGKELSKNERCKRGLEEEKVSSMSFKFRIVITDCETSPCS